MDAIKSGRVDIKEGEIPWTKPENIPSDEELAEFAKKKNEEFDVHEKLRKFHELTINLGQLRDLLDFKTYSAHRFEFEEKESFSLEHIVGLIRMYKINNNI